MTKSGGSIDDFQCNVMCLPGLSEIHVHAGLKSSHCPIVHPVLPGLHEIVVHLDIFILLCTDIVQLFQRIGTYRVVLFQQGGSLVKVSLQLLPDFVTQKTQIS